MSVRYVIKEGCAGFKRARLASFTSITALTISVLLLGILARFAYNTYEIGQALRADLDVRVFLAETDDSRTQRLRSEFEGEEIVREVHFISSDSAAVIFIRDFGAEGAMLADLGFLPASFDLRLHSDAELDSVISMVDRISTYRGVDEVTFNRQLAELLDERMGWVMTTGVGIGLLILVTAMILVFNTIRLTIYAKRGLIKAMKLVGATNGFIRRPFKLEGILQGLLAGLLAAGLHWFIFRYVVPFYIPQFGVLSWPFEQWYYLVSAMVMLAIFMGYLGSSWAARKFIKETTVG